LDDAAVRFKSCPVALNRNFLDGAFICENSSVYDGLWEIEPIS